jgi:cell division protein FtsQ
MFRNKMSRTRKSPPAGVESLQAHERNRVMLKSLLMGGLVVNAVLVLILVYTVFVHMPYFNLRQIDVIGNDYLSPTDVVKASGIQSGANLLLLNLRATAARIRSHPRVRAASVYRRFPGRLTIEIEERIPRAVLAAGKLFYVDRQGEVFPRLTPEDSVRFPLFTGIKPHQLKSREADVRRIIALGLGLLEVLERKASGLTESQISEIRLNLDDGLTLITRSGRRIIMGQGSLELKIERLARLRNFLLKSGRWHNARIIDLNFEDRALVRPGRMRIQG